jgi:ABC-type dipeptide/oligopeptide/nickel transport system permease component
MTFVARRLLLAVPTLAGVLIAVFLLLYVAPGDPVQQMVGERADSLTIARLRAELKLDSPLHVQFTSYARGVLTGDLGRSYITGRPIMQDIRERFPKTAQLAATAMCLAILLGIGIGVLAALNPAGAFDKVLMGSTYLGISFPVFWVGLLLILLFSLTLKWLPPSGYGGGAVLILPALTLGSRSIAYLARVTRSSMLDAMTSEHVRTARAKGLSRSAVVLRHGLRTALIPVITVLGLDVGSYLTGSILTETVFGWPGLGRYVVNAISRRDLPAIQGTVLFLSVVFVLVNLVTDLLYKRSDPRVA